MQQENKTGTRPTKNNIQKSVFLHGKWVAAIVRIKDDVKELCDND